MTSENFSSFFKKPQESVASQGTISFNYARQRHRRCLICGESRSNYQKHSPWIRRRTKTNDGKELSSAEITY